MPAYYVIVAGLRVVVRASADGHVTGSVALPGPSGTPRVLVSAQPFGSPDDRHFVIVVSRGGGLPGVADDTVFRLAVSPGGRPGRPDRLGYDSRGMPVTGAALSPDGRMLALSLRHGFPPGPPGGTVEILDLATGTTGTLAGQAAPGYWPGPPTWAGRDTVVVPWWHSTSANTIPATLTGLRELPVATPGAKPPAARLVTFPEAVPGLESAIVAPGGGSLVVSSCRAGPRPDSATARILELSAADGRPIRVLRTQAARFRDGADVQDAISSQCRVLSVADGDRALVQAFAFGRDGAGRFTPLPGASPGVRPVSAAW